MRLTAGMETKSLARAAFALQPIDVQMKVPIHR